MTDIQPGQMLGPYRILNQVGQGGMATVYKAYHAAMDRYVAVKVLPSEFARSASFMARFQQEARTIANLEHPHILPVHDFGESGGIHYFVMRFLDAGTLKERIEQGPMSLPEIDHIFTQLADALGYAHQRGVIHRDIKPSNALIDSRGNVFLTDFGIAKLVEGSQQLTTTGTITGTPAYMSPEQAQGEKLDPRSDIYSLGIMLYEMVTGQVPFDAETPLAVILKHLNAPLPLPSEITPEVSPEIERVLLKALAKERKDRFASCKELLDAWKTAVAASPQPSAAPAKATGSGTVRPPQRVPTVEAASPAAGTVVTGQLTARRGMPTMWIVAGGAAVVGVLALLVVGAAIFGTVIGPRLGLFTRAPTQIAGGNPTPAASAAPDSTPGEATGPAVAPPSLENATFTSWTAGNTIFNVSVYEDWVFTSGPGSITVWNRNDGSIVRRVTTADGLPSADIRAMLVENESSVWVGTDEGLVFSDGQELTLYNVDDGLDSDYISAITRLSDGRLIVGTTYSDRPGGGLNVFDGRSWDSWPDFPSAHPDENPDVLSNFVNVILENPEGSLWVGTSNGLGRFDGESWTRFTTENGLPSNNIYSLLVDSRGDLFVGTETGAATFDGESFDAIEQGPQYGVSSIVEDSRGRIWLSGGGGVWVYNLDKADWKEFSQDTHDLPAWGMYGAAVDKDGNVAVGSDGEGLVVFQQGGQDISVWKVPNVPLNAWFGGIVPAPDGKLWFIRLYGSDTDVFDPQTETWSSPPADIPGMPLFFDAQGRLWVAEYEKGFWIINGDDRVNIAESQGLPLKPQVHDIVLAQDGTAWITTDNGVALFDGTSITRLIPGAELGLTSDFVRTIFAASDGSLWLGGERNLSHVTPDGVTVYAGGDPFEYDVSVLDIEEDSGGAIWVATEGLGLYRFANGEWKQFTSTDPGVDLPSPYVNSITLAPDGTLWFGTREGAARFDGSEWAEIEVGGEGLIDAFVNDIYVDPDGSVYFATSGGVTRMRP